MSSKHHIPINFQDRPTHLPKAAPITSRINHTSNNISLQGMSWMDSWSRPSKQATFPPPLYLSAGDQVPYCHTCGRVISTKRSQTPAATSSPVKYCSERCRRTKPGAIDLQIEDAFVALLTGDLDSYLKKYGIEEDADELKGSVKNEKPKGDSRLIIRCSDVESLVFGSRFDPTKAAGRKKNCTPRGFKDVGEWKSVDMEDKPPPALQPEPHHSSDEYEDLEDMGVNLSLDLKAVDADHVYFSAGKQHPAQSKAEVNGSVGGEKGWAEKIEETDEMAQKRRDGQKRAEEKEMVRRAARRGVAFGFVVPEMFSGGRSKKQHKGKKVGKGERNKDREEEVEKLEDRDSTAKDVKRKCEAIITKAAVVVEPSFAKGDWGVRWREEV